jgi:hypothetical protein
MASPSVKAVLAPVSRSCAVSAGRFLAATVAAASESRACDAMASGVWAGIGSPRYNGGDDRAECRDAKSRAEFVGSLRDCCRRTCSLRHDAGDDEVAGRGEGQAEAHADDEQGDAELRVAGGWADQCHRRHRDTDKYQPGRKDCALRPVADGDTGQHAEHGRGDPGRQFGQPGPQRVESLNQLEELGQEEHQARKAKH